MLTNYIQIRSILKDIYQPSTSQIFIPIISLIKFTKMYGKYTNKQLILEIVHHVIYKLYVHFTSSHFFTNLLHFKQHEVTIQNHFFHNVQ